LDKIRAFSLELIGLVESGAIRSAIALNEAKIALCKKHGVACMPSNATVLSFAKKRSDRLLGLLKIKPTRSLSGIAVVAIMARPYKCPGSLLQGEETPKSYTGAEPAAMRALSSGFSAKRQVESRLEQLSEAGHSTSKVELIVMGGTFLSQPLPYQGRFVLSAINAVCGSRARSLGAAKKAAEKSPSRIAGITFETRPDFCGKREINAMLRFGGTRCELGVQTIYDRVYRKVNRGHSVADVVNATAMLRDSCFKVTYHYMPGLPTVSLAEDKRAMRLIFESPGFRPDNLKVYPCLVIRGTELYRQWKLGEYEPFSVEKAVKLLSYAKGLAPRWLRIMRIQRDIPAQLISAGVRKSNLRQIVLDGMHAAGKKCNCIRCREAGLLFAEKGVVPDAADAKMFVEGYGASSGREFFISMEDKKRECLFGFARMRIPNAPFRRELKGNAALVRELRVFGLPLAMHERKGHALQHRGFGKALLGKAEEIALESFGSKKLVVISGLGVKPYYYSLGFRPAGPFVSKEI
jgi:elongator complex protein 3